MPRRLASLFLAVSLLAGAAFAQEPAPDYDAWERLATRAEAAVEGGTASTTALEELRAQISESRLSFLDAESVNKARIETLQSQIDALGPAPAEGETEAEDLARRRADLTGELERIQAPRRAATEAFSRATGLISEIDAIIRERETRALLELGPTPLNPVIWPTALGHVAEVAATTTREIQRGLESPAQQAVIRQNLPMIAVLSIIGLVLLSRGRHLMERATRAVGMQGGEVGRVASSFVVSLGQILLPVAGLYALTRAALATGIFGIQGTSLLKALPEAGLSVFAGLWLAQRLFPKEQDAPPLVGIPMEAKPSARFYAGALGIGVGIYQFLQAVLVSAEGAPEALAMLGFPLAVVLGLLLWRLGALMRRGGDAPGSASDDPGVLSIGVRLLGRAIALAALASVLAGAVGYMKLSFGVLVPVTVSLALMGLLTTLHGPIRDIYGLLARKAPEEAREALVPVLISFLITIASLPLFALIWGMREAELGDLWTRFLSGVTFGETRISPTDFLTVIVVFAMGLGLTRLVQNALRTSVLPRTSLDVGGRNAIVSGLGYVGIFLAAVIAITTAGIDLSSLAIVAGALSVGIGFGLQNIVSNFVSGIILLIERPISEGDWIEVGGQMGYVRAISVRSTRIETFDRTDVIIPNADLVSGTVTNWTRGNTVGRVIVPVGVAYGTDTRKVEAVLREIAEAHPMVLKVPPPNVAFVAFGADSMDFEIRAILRDVNYLLATKSDMNHEIAKRFKEEGIEIPFAQRDVWLRNPEALRGAPGQDGGSE